MSYKYDKINENLFESDKARIFCNEEFFSAISKDGSLKQVENLLELPNIVSKVMLMPDAHQGYGFPIGSVCAFDYNDGIVVPGGIGFDINCGVRLLTSNTIYSDEMLLALKKIGEKLFEEIPTGVGCKAKKRYDIKDIDEVILEGIDFCKKRGFLLDDDVLRIEDKGFLKSDKKFISQKAKQRGMMQLGTLGSGNHFLEIGYVDEIYDENFCSNFNISKNSLTMMVHSGSRGLGHQVCSDYIRMMEDSNQELAKNLSDRELIYSKINSEIGQKYLLAMNGASNYAFCNRQILSYLAREVFKKYDISFSLFYDICHNIAKKENLKLENGDLKQVLVHRKGATRAFPKKLLSKGDPFYEFGQPVLLPGSMGTKSYVLISDESEKSLYSLAHGAGRRLSRHKSKHSDFTYDDVMNDLKKENISVFCDSKGSVLEESPKSYKDVDLVVDIIVKNKLSKKAFSIRPILSIKG